MNATAEPGRESPVWRVAPPLVLLLALVLRLDQLGSRPLWTDEGSTWVGASLGLKDLIHRCLTRDASPPLYYMLTSFAIHIADDEAHLRIVSVIASVGLVWLTYRLARLGLSRATSTFAALLCALSPFQVLSGQEARTYVLVAFFLVASVLLYARALVSPKPNRWPAYVLAMTLGMWTQSIAVLGVTVQGTLAVLTPEGRRRFGPWAIALFAAALCYAPWAWMGRGLADHLSSSHWYIPDPDQKGVFKVLRAVLLSPMPLVSAPPASLLPGLDHWLPRNLAWALLVLAPAVPLLVSLPRLWRAGAEGMVARIAWAGAFVPIAAVWVVSHKAPLFLPRYFVFVTPFLAVLYAQGVAAMAPRALRVMWGALLIGAAAAGIVRYERDFTKEPWRQVASDIGLRAARGHTIVLVPFDLDPFAFYEHALHLGVRAVEVSHPDEPFAAHFTPKQLDDLEAAARKNAAGYDEAWVIVRSPNSEVRKEVAHRAELAAGEGRVLVERYRWDSFTGPLRVSRFVRKSASYTRGAALTPLPAQHATDAGPVPIPLDQPFR